MKNNKNLLYQSNQFSKEKTMEIENLTKIAVVISIVTALATSGLVAFGLIDPFFGLMALICLYVSMLALIDC